CGAKTIEAVRRSTLSGDVSESKVSTRSQSVFQRWARTFYIRQQMLSGHFKGMANSADNFSGQLCSQVAICITGRLESA
ncbi:MAG: hypothetical protein ACN6NZ_05080, partial [Burkholderiales bacterium]